MDALRDIAALVGADLDIFEHEDAQFALGVRFAMQAIARAYRQADTELFEFLGEEPEFNLPSLGGSLPTGPEGEEPTLDGDEVREA